MTVASGVAVARVGLVLRVGEREGVAEAAEVGIGVGAGVDAGVGDGKEVGVGVGVIAFVGVGVGVEVAVGVGEGVEVGDGVVGVEVSVGTTVCFITELVANVVPPAITWELLAAAIAPINESSNKVIESTPSRSRPGVSLAKKVLSERWSRPGPVSTLFFIFASLD